MKKENRIYYKQIGTNKWFLLRGISKINDAINYVRANNYMNLGSIGLAQYDQMIINNCSWDNL